MEDKKTSKTLEEGSNSMEANLSKSEEGNNLKEKSVGDVHKGSSNNNETIDKCNAASHSQGPVDVDVEKVDEPTEKGDHVLHPRSPTMIEVSRNKLGEIEEIDKCTTASHSQGPVDVEKIDEPTEKDDHVLHPRSPTKIEVSSNKLGEIEEIDKCNAASHSQGPVDVEKVDEPIEKGDDVLHPHEPRSPTEIEASINKLGEIEEENDVVDYMFSSGEVVWVKTKTESWWPGKISGTPGAANGTKKSDKTGTFLVKCYGNTSFIWCHHSEMRPFLEYFEEMIEKNNSSSFSSSLDMALCEIVDCASPLDDGDANGTVTEKRNRDEDGDDKVASSRKLEESRERKKSKYLSYPYVDLDLAQLYLKYSSSPTRPSSSSSQRGGTTKKPLKGLGVVGKADVIDVPSSVLLSELCFAAIDCSNFRENKYYHSVKSFYSSFREVAFLDADDVAKKSSVPPNFNGLNRIVFIDEGSASEPAPKRSGSEMSISSKKQPRKRAKKSNARPEGGHLLLHFAPGAVLPSRKRMIDIFSQYGLLRESELRILDDTTIYLPYERTMDVRFAYDCLERMRPFGESLVSVTADYLPSYANTKKKKKVVEMVTYVTVDPSHNIAMIKEKAEMMKVALERAGDSISPELRADLENEIKVFLDKINSFPGSSSF